MIGQTLGHYRIESKLGEGGMGVVYRALDTHLNRPVAIKVLRPDAVANPERKRRFVQEAQAASALNHPNLITIYDIGVADGVDYMAMEYVAGKSLDRLIGRKGLRLAEALKYAVQIADALAKAHGAGIVHRDLKPGNIMVNEDGLVKVLDFGLAKLTQLAEDDGLAETVDARAAGTEEGVILGTVAYMSPEQAHGAKLDARSDIFSFGVVLYEMLSGQQAFGGENRMSRITAILTKEPELAVEGLPGELVTILSRCLRKDLNRRFQHMDDVKIALEEVKEDSESGRLAAPATAPLRSRLRIGVVAGLVIAAGAGWWLASRRSTPVQAPVLTRLTSDSGLTTDPALSPDGKLVAYASDRAGEGNLDIWVQQITGGSSMRLTRDAADERDPHFSPDGSKIVFRSERAGGGVYTIPTLGGDARLLAERGREPRFSPDGGSVAYWIGAPGISSAGELWVVASAGGAPRRLRADFYRPERPVWSPDGRHLLFLGWRDRSDTRGSTDWWVTPVDEGPAIRTGAYAALGRQSLGRLKPDAWLAQSNRLTFSASLGDSVNLWEVPIAPRTLQVTGPAERLTFGTGREVQPSPAAARIAFSSLTWNEDIWSLPVEPDQAKIGRELQRLTRDAAPDTMPSASLDGKTVVFLSRRSGDSSVWLKELSSGRETALAPTVSGRPNISPDGSMVVYAAFQGNQGDSYVVATAGGVPRRVCEDCDVPWHWSSDGTRILYVWGEPRRRIGMLKVSSGEKTELLAHPGHGLYMPQFSPDDRWIAFTGEVSPGRFQVFLAPLRGKAAIPQTDWIPITDGSTWDGVPRWSPNGNLLYITSERDGFRCIWVQRLDAATKRPLGSPTPVFHSHSAHLSLMNAGTGGYRLSVTRDKLIFNMGEISGNIWMAEFPGR